MAASASFRVRRLMTPEEIRLLISEKRDIQGFRPGALDHVCFFATDEAGFFVGELEEEPISCVSVVRHTDKEAFVGQYLVYKPYRGTGYGLKMWKRALSMASLPPNCNIGLDSLINIEHMYEKSGFRRAWFVQRVDIVASDAAATLDSTSSGCSLQKYIGIRYAYLFIFTTKVFGEVACRS